MHSPPSRSPEYGGVVADAIDPEFEDLFRPDEVDPYDAGPVELEEVEQVIPAPLSEPSELSEAMPDGRLFRSQGVMGHADTVLAIPIGARLKSLSRTGDAAAMADEPRERIVPVTSTQDSSRSAELPRTPEPAEARPRKERTESSDADQSNAFGSAAIPGFAIWLIIGGATVVLGFVNALMSGGHLGLLTGLALLLSTIACALLASRSDLFTVVIAPPLMFGLAALTAGQFFLGSAGGLLNRLVQVFFTLGANWFWIVGSVVAAVVVMVIRRRRARS